MSTGVTRRLVRPTLTLRPPTHSHPTPHPPPPSQAAADAVLSLDRGAFEGGEDVATVLACVPTEEEAKTLGVRGASPRIGGKGMSYVFVGVWSTSGV